METVKMTAKTDGFGSVVKEVETIGCVTENVKRLRGETELTRLYKVQTLWARNFDAIKREK